MSIHCDGLTNQKALSTVRAGSGPAILLAFGNRGRQVPKIRPTAFTRESSTEAPVWPLPAATGASATDQARHSAVIIDFAQARRGRHAPPIHEEASNERQRRLTLPDAVAIIYVVVAMACYPALAWFLIHS